MHLNIVKTNFKILLNYAKIGTAVRSHAPCVFPHLLNRVFSTKNHISNFITRIMAGKWVKIYMRVFLHRRSLTYLCSHLLRRSPDLRSSI